MQQGVVYLKPCKMKTLITKVTLQTNRSRFIVFTDYKLGNTVYDGFTPYSTLEEAMAAAAKMADINTIDFLSVVRGYNVIDFNIDPAVKSFVSL